MWKQAGAELCQAQESLGLSGLDFICAFLQFSKLAYEFNFCSIIMSNWSVWYGYCFGGLGWMVWFGKFCLVGCGLAGFVR